MDKIILSMDSEKPNQFYVYQLGDFKWQVRTHDGRVVGNTTSLDQVEDTMQKKFSKFPYILYLHSVDVFNTAKPKRNIH